jgi:hypothetical protein
LTAIWAFPPLHDTATIPPLDDVEALGVAMIVSVAVSLADEAPENVIQSAFDEAAHVQVPDVLVIVTLNVPPADVGDNDVAETVYAHDVGGVGVAGVSFLLQAVATVAARSSIE